MVPSAVLFYMGRKVFMYLEVTSTALHKHLPSPPEAMILPLGDQRTQFTGAECLLSVDKNSIWAVWSSLFLRIFQIYPCKCDVFLWYFLQSKSLRQKRYPDIRVSSTCSKSISIRFKICCKNRLFVVPKDLNCLDFHCFLQRWSLPVFTQGWKLSENHKKCRSRK